MKHLLSALLLSFAFASTSMAADDPADFRLTAALLQKVEAVDAEARRLGLDDEEDEDEDSDSDEDIDALVRRIESNPQRRALLSRHGLSARELALAAQAMLHAGTYLAFEGNMNAQAAARLQAGFSAAQKANIELLRARMAGSTNAR